MDHDLSAEPRLVDQLVEVDITGWMTLNPTTLATIMDFSGRTGVRLALLSNAPEPLANAIDSSKWSDSFDRRFYSCRLEGGQARCGGVPTPCYANWQYRPSRSCSSTIGPPTRRPPSGSGSTSPGSRRARTCSPGSETGGLRNRHGRGRTPSNWEAPHRMVASPAPPAPTGEKPTAPRHLLARTRSPARPPAPTDEKPTAPRRFLARTR